MEITGNTTTTTSEDKMNLIKHVTKDRHALWTNVELSVTDHEGDTHPYKVSALGENSIHASAHKTIDEALEQMDTLRDERKM
jgi:bacillopeptidase F (M6 metalloprotease family)